jgi:hypothetical protein
MCSARLAGRSRSSAADCNLAFCPAGIQIDIVSSLLSVLTVFTYMVRFYFTCNTVSPINNAGAVTVLL